MHTRFKLTVNKLPLQSTDPAAFNTETTAKPEHTSTPLIKTLGNGLFLMCFSMETEVGVGGGGITAVLRFSNSFLTTVHEIWRALYL